jgi:hypothetical protein
MDNVGSVVTLRVVGLFNKKIAQLAELAGAPAEKFGPKVDVWKDGVRATATIERIHHTGIRWTNSAPGHSFEAYLLFRFADQAGAEVLVQRDLWIGGTPRPGSTVEVAYLPDAIDTTLDFDRDGVQRPDAAVPRGWGAGQFGTAAIGPYPPLPENPDLDRDRQLFRAGTPIEAEVIESNHGRLMSTWSTHMKFTQIYRANGVDYTKEFWADPHLLPHAGEWIKVVVSADGSEIAPDTDETYYADHGRALVWTTPPALQEIQDDPNGIASQLAGNDKLVAAGDLTEAQASVMREQLQPPENPTIIPGNPVLTRQLNLLEISRKSGQLSEEKYEQMRADALRYFS